MRRRAWTLCVGLLFFLQSFAVSAGSLTPTQMTTVRTDVAANSDLNALPRTGDGYFAMAALYNAQASPNFTVWKSSLTLQQIGDAIDATELVSLTTGKLTQLQTLLLFGPINPSILNRRDAFNQIFSASSGTITRPALLAIEKRFSTRIEKLLATGTGSDVSPATMTFEGAVSYQDIGQALAN